MKRFIDFETANYKYEIYQIGIYCPDTNEKIDEDLNVELEHWESFHIRFNFKPRSDFDDYLEIKHELNTFEGFLFQNPTAFDGDLYAWCITTERKALEAKGIFKDIIDVEKLARRKLDLQSYKLKNVVKHLGLDFTLNWHHAFSDAYATYQVYEAIKDMPDLLPDTKSPPNKQPKQKLSDIQKNVDKDAISSISGLNIVLTGSVPGFQRREDVHLAIAQKGGVPKSSVSPKTDLVVVHDFANPKSKLIKALELGIKTMSSEDFYELIK